MEMVSFGEELYLRVRVFEGVHEEYNGKSSATLQFFRKYRGDLT
jgi:hypothetical protein